MKNAIASDVQKIAWLACHKDLWHAAWVANQRKWNRHTFLHQKVVQQMKNAKLLSQKTYHFDVNLQRLMSQVI